MFIDFNQLELGQAWNLNLNNYLEPELETPPLAQQPMPNTQAIQASLMPQGGVMQSGLTPVENALLSEEEKMIRLRQRGLA
jgi:hypothetical protein